MNNNHVKFFLLLFFTTLISCADPGKWRTQQRIQSIESKKSNDSLMKEMEKTSRDTIYKFDSI